MNQGKFIPQPHQIEFTPIQGFVSIARAAATRLGLGHVWPGPDGLEGVVRQKLSELGVPESVPLKVFTPRQMAVAAGLIKKNRPRRRLKR